MLICKKHTTWQVLYYGDYMNPKIIKTNFKGDRHLKSGVKIATISLAGQLLLGKQLCLIFLTNESTGKT